MSKQDKRVAVEPLKTSYRERYWDLTFVRQDLSHLGGFSSFNWQLAVSFTINSHTPAALEFPPLLSLVARSS